MTKESLMQIYIIPTLIPPEFFEKVVDELEMVTNDFKITAGDFRCILNNSGKLEHNNKQQTNIYKKLAQSKCEQSQRFV